MRRALGKQKLSVAGGRKGSQRDLSHKKDLTGHCWLEAGGGNVRKNAGGIQDVTMALS